MPYTYLITGATSDVGAALVRRVWKPGDIILAQGANDLDRLDGVRELCGDALHCYNVDLTGEESLTAFIEEIRRDFGCPTHIVHLPALRVINTKFRNFDEQRFLLDFNVQVLSALRICKAFLPGMMKAKFGRLLFMLTDYIIGVPPKNTTAYIVAKNALRGLARSLATEAAPSGVTVNCVAPYMMETRFLQDTPDLIVEASAAANPMGRNARVEDVVPAMAFLLSDEAGFISGAELPVTGGAKY